MKKKVIISLIISALVVTGAGTTTAVILHKSTPTGEIVVQAEPESTTKATDWVEDYDYVDPVGQDNGGYENHTLPEITVQ